MNANTHVLIGKGRVQRADVKLQSLIDQRLLLRVFWEQRIVFSVSLSQVHDNCTAETKTSIIKKMYTIVTVEYPFYF